MNIQPLAGCIGAQVSGIDLSQSIGNQAADSIHAAFLEHGVVVFREQNLTARDLLRVARIIGEPCVYPFIDGLADAPEVIEILKTEQDTVNFGGSWHTDTPYLEEPALGSLLYALEVPAAGGDTLFANATAAYDALSLGMKSLVDKLRAFNSSESLYQGGRAAAMSRLHGMKDTYKLGAEVYESVHPVVRTHPDTGTKALYVSRSHARHFEGMTADESRPLIEYLADQIVRPEFTCRVRWQPGSLAIWDNRRVQHRALNDYHGQRRLMRRVTLRGDKPF